MFTCTLFKKDNLYIKKNVNKGNFNYANFNFYTKKCIEILHNLKQKKITKMCFEKYLLTCLKAQVVHVNINLLKYKKINKFQ